MAGGPEETGMARGGRMTTRVAQEEGTASAPMEVPEVAKTYSLTHLQPLTWPLELAARESILTGAVAAGSWWMERAR